MAIGVHLARTDLEEGKALRRRGLEQGPVRLQEVGEDLLAGSAVDAQSGDGAVPSAEMGVEFVQSGWLGLAGKGKKPQLSLSVVNYP